MHPKGKRVVRMSPKKKKHAKESKKHAKEKKKHGTHGGQQKRKAAKEDSSSAGSEDVEELFSLGQASEEASGLSGMDREGDESSVKVASDASDDDVDGSTKG